MRTAITMGLLLLMAAGARASDEYVNPMFCYRIVQPAGIAKVIPRADGSGITMEWGAPCPGPSCISIGIAAGYPRGPGDLPHAHAYYRSQGWTTGAPVRRTIAGTRWVQYAMSRRGAALTLSEFSRGRGKATYVVLAQYPADAAPRARRQVAGLLASLRWLSACL
jgi:hypothetical protein